MNNGLSNATLSDVITYSNFASFLDESKEFVEELLQDQTSNPMLVGTIFNIQSTLEGMQIMAERDDVIDDITKLDMIKELINIHQKLISFTYDAKTQFEHSERLQALLEGLNSIYVIFLIGKVLQPEVA